MKEIDLGLERVSEVLQRLNSRRLKAKKAKFTITVVGTNGKGSCVALLESILITAGYQVGVYSTPHLTQYNERIRLAGESVTDVLLTQAFARINQARKDISLSYFEFGTLAALTIFAEQSVDVQILEVGLGGRLDAVNIVDADAVIVSSISVDHIDWLGDDLSKIALEKAGVFRPQQKVVCGDATVPQSLIDHATELGLDLVLAGRNYNFNIEKEHWYLKLEYEPIEPYPFPALKGVHQIQNAAAVISLLAQLTNILPVTKVSIEMGLQRVRLAGRLQQVGSQPDVFLDVAHNAESANVLAQFIRSNRCNGKLHAVFSILADKQIQQVIEPFLGLVDQWHLAALDTARAADVDALTLLLDSKPSQCYLTYKSIQSAFKSTVAAADKDDVVICFGSFYVVEACLEAL